MGRNWVSCKEQRKGRKSCRLTCFVQNWRPLQLLKEIAYWLCLGCMLQYCQLETVGVGSLPAPKQDPCELQTQVVMTSEEMQEPRSSRFNSSFVFLKKKVLNSVFSSTQVALQKTRHE